MFNIKNFGYISFFFLVLQPFISTAFPFIGYLTVFDVKSFIYFSSSLKAIIILYSNKKNKVVTVG